MGVDTRGLLRPSTTEKELVTYLESKYENVKSFVDKRSMDNYFSGFINFTEGTEKRSIFYLSKGMDNHKIDGLNIEDYSYISLGKHGNSIGVIKDLCEYFGGAIDEDDCDDEDFYFVNKDLFFKDIDFTFEKELSMILNKEDYKNVLELIEKYK